MADKTIFQSVPANLLKLGVDRKEFDNGSWFAAVDGTLIRAVTEVNPGTTGRKREPITEDHRMGPLDQLNDYSEESSQVQLVFATHQRAIMEALMGSQASFLSKTEANAANVCGDPTAATPAAQVKLEDIGQLLLVRVDEESGGATYEMSIPRFRYIDVDTSALKYQLSAYNSTDHKMYDVENSGTGGTLEWGDKLYVGECAVSGMTLTAGQVFTYDPSQQYTVECTDGIAIAEIPDWSEGDYAFEAGDTVAIINICFFYCQFGSAASSSSYQVNLPFSSNERVALELFRMLGDNPGGKSSRMVRRVYPFAQLSAPPDEPTRGDDGTPTKLTAIFDVYPDNTETGDGSAYFEQNFDW